MIHQVFLETFLILRMAEVKFKSAFFEVANGLCRLNF